jgi:basic membrane protein A and related proteins
MRIRSHGLALFAGLAIIVSACGGASADIKKVGLVTDVGTLQDKSFNEASWIGAQDGAKAIGGTANNIVTKAPADYAANIKTFVDQGYGIIVTVGFAMGDATTIAAKTYPNVKFIGVDQGVCVDETGKSDPKFACKGDASKLLPNYQGLVYKEDQVGYLAGVLAASVSKSGVIGTVGGINTIPAVVRYINGYRNGAASVKPDGKVLVQYVSTDITKAFNDPGTGKSIAQQMLGQKADVIFQVAGLSGAGALEAACAVPGVAGIGVDVDQSKSLPNLAKCILTSAEKSLSATVVAAIQKVGDKTDKGGTSVFDASSTPPGVGLAPFSGDYASLVTPEIQAAIDKAFAGLKDGTVDPCKPTPCDKKD